MINQNAQNTFDSAWVRVKTFYCMANPCNLFSKKGLIPKKALVGMKTLGLTISVCILPVLNVANCEIMHLEQ